MARCDGKSKALQVSLAWAQIPALTLLKSYPFVLIILDGLPRLSLTVLTCTTRKDTNLSPERGDRAEGLRERTNGKHPGMAIMNNS